MTIQNHKTRPTFNNSIIEKTTGNRGLFHHQELLLNQGVAEKVHNRNIEVVLNKEEYYYRRLRKKSLLKRTYLHARKAFCERIKKCKLGQDFWKNHVAMYLDSKGFQFKTRPFDQGWAPFSEWCKKKKKKKEGCTAKGNNVGSINLNFMVGISYNKEVVPCEHYKNAITSQKMEQIIRNAIPEV